MAYATWPSAVSTTILNDGYAPSIVPSVVTSEVDVGAPKMRLRSSYVQKRHDIQLRFDRVHIVAGNTASEYELFRAFVLNVLAGGVLSFGFPTPPDFTVKECVFYFTAGNPPYKVTKFVGDYAFVSFTLQETT